jgi:hypothetical protein
MNNALWMTLLPNEVWQLNNLADAMKKVGLVQWIFQHWNLFSGQKPLD